MNRKHLLAAGCLALCTGIGAQQPPRPMGKEERRRHVSETISKEIKMSASQKAKVDAAYKDFFNEMEKIRPQNGKPETPPPPPPPPGKKEEVEKLARIRDAKIKTILTEAQYQKYQQVEKSLRPPRPGGPPPPRS